MVTSPTSQNNSATSSTPRSSVLLFEFVCGGGCYRFPDLGRPTGSLLSEGAEMLQALADELNSLPNVDVTCPIDVRVPHHLELRQSKTVAVNNAASLNALLERFKSTCDFFVLVAPEIENALQFYTDYFADSKKLVSPNSAVVEIGSDKWTTYQFFQKHQIPTPCTRLGSHFEFSTGGNLCKPRLGAGSYGIKRLENAKDLQDVLNCQGIQNSDFIVQEFVSGLPASIALFRTPNETIFFPAVKQELDEMSFAFLGCSILSNLNMQRRARNLLEQVASNLPQFTGYLGIDIVLGIEASDDVVIEMNPRFTTSFCKTRNFVEGNCFQFLRNHLVETKSTNCHTT